MGCGKKFEYQTYTIREKVVPFAFLNTSASTNNKISKEFGNGNIKDDNLIALSLNDLSPSDYGVSTSILGKENEPSTTPDIELMASTATDSDVHSVHLALDLV